MKQVYLVAAVLGALVPILFFAGMFHGEPTTAGTFFREIFANPAAGGFAADLFISSFVFWIYMFAHRDGPKPWLFIALNLFIGLSCALPAYLYQRARLQSP